MANEYGKLAYEKCFELERRLNRLEKAGSENLFKEIRLVGENGSSASQYERTFRFLSMKSDDVNFNLSGTLSTSSAQVIVYVNGIKVKSVYISERKFSVGFKCMADKGQVTVKAVILYYLDFDIDSVELHATGAVDYTELNSSVSVVNGQDRSYVLLRVNGEFFIYVYNADGLEKKAVFTADDAVLLKSASGADVAVLNGSTLKIKYLNTETFALTDGITVDDGVLRISGGYSENGYLIYAIKNGNVFSYVIENGTVSKTDLKICAKRVYSSCDVENTFIIADYNSCATLVKV